MRNNTLKKILLPYETYERYERMRNTVNKKKYIKIYLLTLPVMHSGSGREKSNARVEISPALPIF